MAGLSLVTKVQTFGVTQSSLSERKVNRRRYHSFRRRPLTLQITTIQVIQMKFSTLSNRGGIVDTPLAAIAVKLFQGKCWCCTTKDIACALGYSQYNHSALSTFTRICNQLAGAYGLPGGSRCVLLADAVEVILPNIADAIRKTYRNSYNRPLGSQAFYNLDDNVQSVRTKLMEFMATHEPPECIEDEDENFDDTTKPFVEYSVSDLSWEDFSSLATWLAEEISGYYYMDKKSYKNQPSQVPYQHFYRKPITLFHEETTVFAMFIKWLFREFWSTGKTSGFAITAILKTILRKLGMARYYCPPHKSVLYDTCSAFATAFPDFIKIIERRMRHVAV